MPNDEHRSYSELSAADIERLLRRAHRERSEYLTSGLRRLLKRLRLRRTRRFKLAPQSR